jgi:D-alanyl-D-alanine dipeptidase
MKTSLVKLSKVIPGIAEDLVYATKSNFTGQAVYPEIAVAYLCVNPALRLKKVQECLSSKDLFLKVWDAYRPLSVQKIFWDLVPDTRYVGNPAIGSKHNRGAAVDVTLIDAKGNELPMQSALDDFSERAHRGYKGCNSDRLKNVDLLSTAMADAGFILSNSEWWHFDDPEWQQYPVLDCSFEELLHE